MNNPIPDTGIDPSLPPEIHTVFETIRATAREIFETRKLCLPVLFLKRPGEHCVALPLEGLEKDAVGTLIDAGLQIGAAVVFIHEAWLGTVPDATAKAINEGGPVLEIAPRAQLDRKEAVVARLYLMEGDKERIVQSSAMIARPKKGDPTLGPWATMDSATEGVKYQNRSYDHPPGAILAGGDIIEK